MRQTNLKQTSVIVLILVNLVPLFGVLFLGWEIFTVMFLFWLESAVIAFYTGLKLLKITNYSLRNILLIPFFIFHFGMFMFVHLIFIVNLFGMGRDGFELTLTSFWTLFTPSMIVAVLALSVSHGISHYLNFIRNKEYKPLSKTAKNNRLSSNTHKSHPIITEELVKEMRPTVMLEKHNPYRRVVVMHVTIILGGFVTAIFQAPQMALVILIILKILIDARTHMKEHKFI